MMQARRQWIAPATLRDGLAVAGVAVAVRALYLWQSAGGPFFGEPLVDAATYHELARGLAADGIYNERFFWQAPLYPLSLAALYALCGVSVTLARIAGALLGVVTVLLTWRLGWRLLGPRLGLAAGLIMALHGVQLYFESDLVATGLATFWVVALVTLAVAMAERPRPILGLLLGAAGVLAILTRTVLLVPFLAVLGWVLWPRGSRQTPTKPSLPGKKPAKTIPAKPKPAVQAAAGPAFVVMLGAALVAVPFAAITHHQTGRTGLWPASGGINLYIGNHPDFPATLTIRPGQTWRELKMLPLREAGLVDPWAASDWYRDRTIAHIVEQPGAWLAGLGQKLLHLLSGRELPRNVDPYQQRAWSSVLAALLWKAGPFGFPAGVLLPLAVYGLVVARRRLPGVIPLFIGSYAAILIAVFVVSRYRAPLWPLLTLAAVAGAAELWRRLRSGPSRRGARGLLLSLAGLLSLALVVTVPGPFAPEKVDLTAELWVGAGSNQLRRNELEAAAMSFRRALAIRSDDPDAWHRLGFALAQQDSFAAAVPCYERYLSLVGEDAEARQGLEWASNRAAHASYQAARVREQQGGDAEAIAGYRQALSFKPGWPEALARLAWVLATSAQEHLRDGAEALELARAAIAGHGEENPYLLEVMAAAERQAAAEQGETD